MGELVILIGLGAVVFAIYKALKTEYWNDRRNVQVCLESFDPDMLSPLEGGRAMTSCIDYLEDDGTEYHVNCDLILGRIAISTEPITLEFATADNHYNPDDAALFTYSGSTVSNFMDLLNNKYDVRDYPSVRKQIQDMMDELCLLGAEDIYHFESVIERNFSSLKKRTKSAKPLYFAFIHENTSRW